MLLCNRLLHLWQPRTRRKARAESGGTDGVKSPHLAQLGGASQCSLQLNMIALSTAAAVHDCMCVTHCANALVSPVLNASFALVDSPLLFLHLQSSHDGLPIHPTRLEIWPQVEPLGMQLSQQVA